VAPGAEPVPARGGRTRRLIASALAALTLGCGGREAQRSAESELQRTRIALGASFVGGSASGLRALLHRDMIVQPPEPDSALRGAAAADYLERLARQSAVTRSELVPVSVAQEGGFLLERGGWQLESGEQTFTSRYVIRWQESPSGWQVVLWRWTLFRWSG
jgi:hypothetical protein